MRNLEHAEQAALISWVKYEGLRKFPELALLFAIPNGGKRSKVTAALLKAEGVFPGVPDMFLPVSRLRCHGLFIEMKVGKNKPTKAQLDFMCQVRSEGYKAVVCWGWIQARNALINYLTSEEED